VPLFATPVFARKRERRRRADKALSRRPGEAFDEKPDFGRATGDSNRRHREKQAAAALPVQRRSDLEQPDNRFNDVVELDDLDFRRSRHHWKKG